VTPLVTRIDHATIITHSIDKALQFYCGILGLEVDPSRPDLGYPGAWLNLGNGQIHIMELPNPDPTENRPAHGGRDRHIALVVSDLDQLISRLEAAGIPCSKSKSGRKAAFCRDYDGNAVELVEKR
jgi:glyoxylase I family protein